MAREEGTTAARRVVVTGASSGIGLATALHLAGLGFRVVGTVRSGEKADVLRKHAADVGVDVEPLVVTLEDVEEAEGLLRDVAPWGLVNNAGWMNLGTIEDVPTDAARRQLHAMLLAPMRLAAAVLPLMRDAGGGRIVNVSSVLARTTGPIIGWYTATKHGLSAATDALRIEAASAGVQVVLVEPGGFRTDIWERSAGELEQRRQRSAEPQAYDRALAILHALEPRMGDPASVADVIGQALLAERPRARYVVGADARPIELVSKLVPRPVKDLALRVVLGL